MCSEPASHRPVGYAFRMLSMFLKIVNLLLLGIGMDNIEYFEVLLLS